MILRATFRAISKCTQIAMTIVTHVEMSRMIYAFFLFYLFFIFLFFFYYFFFNYFFSEILSEFFIRVVDLLDASN